MKTRHARRKGFERLERRQLLASDWQNSVLPSDVDLDGEVLSRDALQIVNQLNWPSLINPDFTFKPRDDASPTTYFDVDGDQRLSPLDALLVINELNREEAAEGPGLVTQDNWDVRWISDHDGLWNDPANWSSGQVPGPNERVLIDRPDSNPRIVLVGAGIHVQSIYSTESLTFEAGDLTLKDDSTFQGNVHLKPHAEIRVQGAGNVATLTGAVTIEGGSLRAQQGAVIEATGITSYRLNNGVFGLAVLEAEGDGSLLNLSNLTHIEFANQGSRLTVKATSGGQVNLSKLAAIDEPLTSDDFVISSVDAGSLIRLPLLKSLKDEASGSSFQVMHGGSIETPQLDRLNGFSVTLDGSPSMTTDQWIELKNGKLNLRGAEYRFPNLSDIHGTSLVVSSGANLTLPSVKTYRLMANAGSESVFQSSGLGSYLALPNLTEIDSSDQGGALTIHAVFGGQIDLRRVSQMVSPTGADSFSLIANDAGSLIDVSSLVSIDDPQRGSRLISEAGGKILSSALKRLNGVKVSFDEAENVSTSSWIEWTQGAAELVNVVTSFPALLNASGTYLQVSGGSLALPQLASLARGGLSLASGATIHVPQLTNIDGASFELSDGAVLRLLGVRSYSLASDTTSVVTLAAHDQGSMLDLSNVDRLILSDQGSQLQVLATGGGRVDLRHAVLLQSSRGGDDLRLTSSGDGSTIDVNALQSLRDPTRGSTITVVHGGTMNAPNLRVLHGVEVNLDGTGNLATHQWTEWTDGVAKLGVAPFIFPSIVEGAGTNFEVFGGHLEMPSLKSIRNGGLRLEGGATGDFPQLTNIDGASIFVNSGVTLILPAVKSYALTGGAFSVTTLEVDGLGSTLDLSSIEDIEFRDQGAALLMIATSGGKLDLRRVRSILGGTVHMTAAGHHGQIDLEAVRNISTIGASTINAADASFIDLSKDHTELNLVGVVESADGEVTGNYTSGDTLLATD